MNAQVMNQQTAVENQQAQARPQHRYVPQVDIYENNDEIVVLADLPGVAERQLQIEVDKGVLTLEAKIVDQQNAADISYYRQFKLSERVDGAAGEAQLRDGVLTLKLPKLEAAKPKKIAVTTVH